MIIEAMGVLYVLGQAYTFYKDNKEYVEVAKDGYEAIKGAKEYLEVKEDAPKLIDMEWVKASGFEDQMKKKGYTLRWTRPEKIATRELEGYEVLYEVEKKVKRKLVLKDGSILMGKKA